MGLEIGSTSYPIIAWTVLTLPWLIALLVYIFSKTKTLANILVTAAFLIYILMNIYLIRHAHHLSDFPFGGFNWWPIWVFLSFKMALAIFYSILIRIRCNPIVFIIICGGINLVSVFNFKGVIAILSLE